jgi:hypothetical protein
MDNYYLNNAVYLVEEFLKGTTNPPYGGEVTYGDRAEHCWNGDPTRPTRSHACAITRCSRRRIVERLEKSAPPGCRSEELAVLSVADRGIVPGQILSWSCFSTVPTRKPSSSGRRLTGSVSSVESAPPSGHRRLGRQQACRPSKAAAIARVLAKNKELSRRLA